MHSASEKLFYLHVYVLDNWLRVKGEPLPPGPVFGTGGDLSIYISSGTQDQKAPSGAGAASLGSVRRAECVQGSHDEASCPHGGYTHMAAPSASASDCPGVLAF